MVDLSKFKKNMRNDILNTYSTDGYKVALQKVYYLIKNSNKLANEIGEKSLPIQIRGECCELLLELGIMEYARVKNLPWFTYKGLVIERRDHKKGTTELDLTLFTPSRIILFESKYRKGKVKLIDECKIVPEFGSVTDVYKQNIMHLDNLRKYVYPAIKTVKLNKPFGIVLFVESCVRVQDMRKEEYKSLVPLISLENLEQYLNTLESNKNVVWDISHLHKILTELDKHTDVNLKKHMKEVSKRNGNKH